MIVFVGDCVCGILNIKIIILENTEIKYLSIRFQIFFVLNGSFVNGIANLEPA